MSSNKTIVTVKMFSDFQMIYDGVVLTDETIRSNMVMKLLTYLLCNRKNILNASELSEILWAEDESDNPIGALKNLMYRLRTILQKTYGKTEFIKTLRGSYAWNQEIEVSLDIEEFEKNYKDSHLELAIDKKIEMLCTAVELYTGSFLPKFSTEHWVVKTATYYHSLYISCVKELADLYDQSKQYEKMEHLCTKALKLEELDEAIHCMLMKAFLFQGKKSLAEEHYKVTSDILYSQLGTKPSEEMQEFYKDILKEIKKEEMDLSLIQEDIEQVHKENGAYFCEYGIFKEIYNLQARQAKRLGIAVYCGLITIDSALKLPVNSEAYRKFRDTSMENLQKVLLATLRSGDVFSRYSATQFMVLLPTCTYEGGNIVMDRIKTKYAQMDPKQHTVLICDLKEQGLDS